MPSTSIRRESKRHSQEVLTKFRSEVSQSRWQVPKRKRHSPEQIVKHLREAERMLGEGKTVTQVCKRIGVTEVLGMPQSYPPSCP